MKNIIMRILLTGYSSSKKTIKDFTSYLYILEYVLTTNTLGFVVAKNNAFWNIENEKNRLELVNDISSIRRKDIKDTSYFHIINRFENGDKYGIVV